MKYMLWTDLEPGDVLQLTDEYLSYCGEDFVDEFQNKYLIISEITYEKIILKLIFIIITFKASIMMEQLVVAE